MSACVLSELALASQQQWWRAEDPHRPTPTWFAEAIALHTNCVSTTQVADVIRYGVSITYMEEKSCAATDLCVPRCRCDAWP